MPGMDGLSFLATKARIPAVAAIPVVVVSGSAPRDAPRGVVAWLEKPCLYDALLRVLRPWRRRGAAPQPVKPAGGMPSAWMSRAQ